MVNTGKPSGACGVCRERRIKCDETKPACLKCIRSGRPCTGYSHGFKLRDQTQRTIIKAKLGKPRGRRQGKAGQEVVKTSATSDKSESCVSSLSPSDKSPTQEPARQRSFSLPSRSALKIDEDGPRGHRRSSSFPLVKKRDYCSLDLLAASDSTKDSQLWQIIDIPLVVSQHAVQLIAMTCPLWPCACDNFRNAEQSLPMACTELTSNIQEQARCYFLSSKSCTRISSQLSTDSYSLEIYQHCRKREQKQEQKKAGVTFRSRALGKPLIRMAVDSSPHISQ